MPTGYTDAISQGITFKEFALRCARAFGALMSMRDDNLDAPIPDKFEISPFYAKRIESVNKRLAHLNNLTAEEAEAEAEAEFKRESERVDAAIRNSQELIAKYTDMLRKVEAWQPPTPDHEELKGFMAEQIVNSIKYDDMAEYYTSHPVVRLVGASWLKEAKEKARAEIEYAIKEGEKEIERVEERTKWVRVLKESLQEESLRVTTR